MLSSPPLSVTSVTFAKCESQRNDPFDFLFLEPLSHAQIAIDAAAMAARKRLQTLAQSELAAQSQLEFSASAEKVKELLDAAKSGGMMQKDFEVLTAKLRPGRSDGSERSRGWNGVLWHHYYVLGARMRLLSFSELVDQFHGKKWISAEQKDQFNIYAWTKQNTATIAREIKTPITRAERSRREAQFLEDIGMYSFHDKKDV